MIPDAAVGAAMSSLPSGAFFHIDRDDVARMLEAASPNMLVPARVEAKGEAWVEALEWADDNGYLTVHIDSCSNPYERPAP